MLDALGSILPNHPTFHANARRTKNDGQSFFMGFQNPIPAGARMFRGWLLNDVKCQYRGLPRMNYNESNFDMSQKNWSIYLQIRW